MTQENVIEQNVAEALRLSHRAYVLREGRVALAGDAHTLRQSSAVQDVFLGRTQSAAAS